VIVDVRQSNNAKYENYEFTLSVWTCSRDFSRRRHRIKLIIYLSDRSVQHTDLNAFYLHKNHHSLVVKVSDRDRNPTPTNAGTISGERKLCHAWLGLISCFNLYLMVVRGCELLNSAAS
jgi:hypothetical protein